MKLDKDKREVQKQWDTDPCGANTVQEVPRDSLEYYRAIREHRYKEYGPWFSEVIGFEKYKDLNILEIGVGLGSDHYSFATNGNRMTALDLSEEHLRQTKRHLLLEGLTTKAIFGDAENIPFNDECFDLVYSFGVLHHTPDTEKAIQEVYRVLKSNGSAVIGLYHRNSWFYWLRTIFWNGLVHGGLFKKSKRRLLSEIEYRASSDSALPLVKVYSRKEIKDLFFKFESCEVISCHVEPSHFAILGRWLNKINRDWLERKLGFGGWYLVVKAKK